MPSWSSESRVLIVGASRGLGLELALQSPFSQVDVVSRTAPPEGSGLSHLCFDMSRTVEVESLSAMLAKYQLMIYCAGGGPFGRYEKLKFHAHEWAWQVSFLAAAKLLHASLKCDTHFVAIGSSIAEFRADPQAASYAAAKSALAGLMLSVANEGNFARISLISPGYMDTSLLPPGSWPRSQALLKPDAVAKTIWKWLQRRSESDWKLVLPNQTPSDSASSNSGLAHAESLKGDENVAKD